jgi:molybdopterin synthase sulfur carrier subunit
MGGPGTTAEDGPVSVLFFASAREVAGTSRASFDCSGTTVGELVEQLGATYGPALAKVMESCRTWVNGFPAVPERILHGGDEVAVLPPVSGG